MLRRSVALFVLLCATTALAADTEGLEFQALFFRNQLLNTTALKLHFVNNQDTNTEVTLSFYLWDGSYSDQSPASLQGFPLLVRAHSFASHTMDTRLIYPTIGPGLNNYPDLRVHIKSNVKISVYAVNVATLSNKQHQVGDTYLVLPNSMAGENYVVSLPDAVETSGSGALWQMKVLFFIPVDDNVQLTIEQFGPTVNAESKISLRAKEHTDLHYFAQMTGFGNSLFKISSRGTGKFLVLAGVTCAPDKTDCDYAAFMPPPIVEYSDCSPCSAQDDHIISSDGDSYFLSAPSACVGSVPYTVKNEMGSSARKALDTTKYTDSFPAPTSGSYFWYTSQDAPLQMTRVANRSSVGGGIYLDIVPSLSQYLKGTTGFYVESEATATIIMDSDAFRVLTLDGQIPNGHTGYISGWNIVRISNLQAGSHTVSASVGRYSIELQVGSVSGYSMGFVPAYNAQTSEAAANCVPITTVAPLTTPSVAPNTTPGAPTTAPPATQPPPSPTTSQNSPTTPPVTPSPTTTPGNSTTPSPVTLTTPGQETTTQSAPSQITATAIFTIIAALIASFHM